MSAPSPWVVRFAPLIRPGGRVLDLACGGGRHLLLLLSRGHEVVGIDRDLSALASLGDHPALELRSMDLETLPPPDLGNNYDGIVVTRYLHRPLWPALLAALHPDGVLIYETFGRGNERFGRPRNPRFLLEPGELLHVTQGVLDVIAYEHGIVTEPQPGVLQRICAGRGLRTLPP